MAVPEDVGRDFLPGELLPARNLLDPGLFRQAVYGPKHRLGAQVAGAPAGEKPHLAGLDLPESLQSPLATEGGQPGPHGHQAPGAGHEEAARIHRREGAGGQAQGRAGLDARQDLEAAGQEDGHREAGVAPRPRFLASLKQKI